MRYSQVINLAISLAFFFNFVPLHNYIELKYYVISHMGTDLTASRGFIELSIHFNLILLSFLKVGNRKWSR